MQTRPNDIAALLTVFSRRLVTVWCKTRDSEAADAFYLPADAVGGAVNAFNEQSVDVWRRGPVRTITGPHGTSLLDTEPNHVPIKPEEFRTFLSSVANHPQATALLSAIRSYHFALKMLKKQPTVAYPALVTCVEALANKIYSDAMTQTDEELMESSVAREFSEAARRYGVSDSVIRELYILSQSKNRKLSISKKFQRFLQKFGVDADKEPYIYPNAENISEKLVPLKPTLQKNLEKVYGKRSGASHGGTTFPDYISIGLDQQIAVTTVHKLMSGQTDCPTLLWFERIVAKSLHEFILHP